MSSLALRPIGLPIQYEPGETYLKAVGKKINFASVCLCAPLYECIDWGMRCILVPFDEEDSCYMRVAEVFRRIFVVCFAAVACLPGAGLCLFGQALHQFGDYLTGEIFTHLQGDALIEEQG